MFNVETLRKIFRSDEFRTKISSYLKNIAGIFYLPCVVLSGEYFSYVFLSIIMVMPLFLLIANWKRYHTFVAIIFLPIVLAGSYFFTNFIYLIYDTGGAEFGNFLLLIALTPYVFLITPLVYKSQKKDREVPWSNFLLSIFENKIIATFLIIYIVSFFFNPPLTERIVEYQEEKHQAKYLEESARLKSWDAFEIVNDNLPDSIEFWTAKRCPDSEKNRYVVPKGYVLVDCYEEMSTRRRWPAEILSKIILNKVIMDYTKVNQSFSNEDVTLNIFELDKIYNEDNSINKVSFDFKIINNTQSNIKIPAIQIGKSFIFKNNNILFSNSKIINNGFREKTDGYDIIIKPGETRVFSMESDINKLNEGGVNEIKLETFKYLQDEEIYSIDVNSLMFKNFAVNKLEDSENSKEIISYIFSDTNYVKIITQNGNTFIINKTIDEVILDCIANAQDVQFYKEEIEALNNGFGSSEGDYTYLTYTIKDGLIENLKIEGLDP
ncbi:MAG: hypothetical protein WCR93_04245 [Bacilli bacterium]